MKYSRHEDYHPEMITLSERALLSIWPSLADYHRDLVLVGGLVTHYICVSQADILPAVTMDVDLGITLAASPLRYEAISARLAELGFKREDRRFVKRIGGIPIPLDFLMEAVDEPNAGAQDQLAAAVFPGIERALLINRECAISGPDFSGTEQRCNIRVCEAGPYLVLKLNAFASRQLPKDAFDIHRAVLHYDRGPRAAAALFAAEQGVNSGYPQAREALAKYFSELGQEGPQHGAEFFLGKNPIGEAAQAERQRRLEEFVTLGRTLLEE